MTIHKKVSRKPPAYHQKSTGNHHRRSKRYRETYFPYIPLVLVVVASILGNFFINVHRSVLDYATDLSVQNLLDDTNTQRISNGEAKLTINALLNTAAQSKASDMSARNYWSHNTPNGQTPWTFMTAAGYSYRLAGENLAYGFTTAADTLTGWMNSPGHRANILNSGYTEVGFGFINIANYQSSGPETLVVAMYGTPQTIASAPVAAAATPTSGAGSTAGNSSAGAATTSPTKTAGSSEPAQPAATATSPASTPSQLTNQSAVAVPTDTAAKAKAKVETKPQQVARIQVITAGKAAWSVAAASIIGLLALAFFLLRHGIAWHKIFVKGERYLLRHPLLDISLVALVSIAFILTRTVGHTH